MRHAQRVAVAASLLCACCATGAAAQTGPEPLRPVSPDQSVTTASFGDWTLRCEAPQPGKAQRLCEAVQTVQVHGETAPIAQIAFGHASSTEPVKLVVVLPVNVMFPSIVTISAGDKDAQPIELAWHRCLPVGCFAEAATATQAMRRWRGEGGRGRITFKDGTGRDIVLPISFRGLAQALDALARQ